MSKIPFLSGLALILLVAAGAVPSIHGENENNAASVNQEPAYPDRPSAQRFAPEREADMLHLALDVTPDFTRRSVAGLVTWSFKSISRPLESLRLDAVHLDIHKVSASVPLAGWQATDKELVITFAAPLPVGQEANVLIDYAAEQPAKGLYFRVPSNGYLPMTDAQLFTQGEAEEARYWYPCYDSPNDKFTSEITCHVPKDMTVLSNGVLVSEEPEMDSSGLKASHWKQDKPHSNYLVSLVAGYFNKLSDRYRDVPLTFYTPPSEFVEAPNSFHETRNIMAFYESEIGVPFPWAKYGQVCVADFVAGGMENTSLTTLTDRTLFPASDENVRTSQSLVAHEMAHQWFGDFVTCKDWSQTWLNEGFATYYAHLYDEHKDGRDAMLYGLYKDAGVILGNPADTRPTVTRQYDQPLEMFNYHIYGKGSWILHMLRNQLGVDLYRRAIKTYLERHEYGTVGTEDLRAAIEEVSGRSFDQFFDQWVYHGGQPVLDAQYTWDEKNKFAKITITQKQAHTSDGGLFQMPLTLRFESKKGGRVDRVVQVTRETEDFYVALAAMPENVRLDPDYTLLADIRANVPAPMLYAQLFNPGDVVGRLLALRQLADGSSDDTTIAKLKQVLQTDPFYGVRINAAEALYKIHRTEALAALIESRAQPDARARQAVFSSLGRYYHPKACAALLESLGSEKNEAIQATILAALGSYPQPDVQTAITGYLDSHSFRNRLVDAAFQALKDADDPASAGPVQNCLQRRGRELTSAGYAAGLDTLATVAHEQPNKDQARLFLANQLNNPKLAVKVAAIRALGTLRDEAALPALRTFVDLGKEHPEQAAAEKAVAAIRDNRAGGAEMRDLRDEISALQRQNKETKDALDQLKQQVQAKGILKGSGAIPAAKINPTPRKRAATSSLPGTNLP